MDINKARENVRTYFFRGEVETICSMDEIGGMMDPKAAYQVLLVYRKAEYVPNFCGTTGFYAAYARIKFCSLGCPVLPNFGNARDMPESNLAGNKPLPAQSGLVEFAVYRGFKVR